MEHPVYIYYTGLFWECYDPYIYYKKKVTVNLEDEHTIIAQQLPTYYLWTDEQIIFCNFQLCVTGHNFSKSMNRCSKSVIGKRRGITIMKGPPNASFFAHILAEFSPCKHRLITEYRAQIKK